MVISRLVVPSQGLPVVALKPKVEVHPGGNDVVAGFTVRVKDLTVLSFPELRVILNVYVPAVVGVPEITAGA